MVVSLFNDVACDVLEMMLLLRDGRPRRFLGAGLSSVSCDDD